MHRALDQEPVASIPLEHQPVEESLGLLEQAEGSVELVLGYEMNGRVVELVQDKRNLVLVEMEFISIQFLEAVFYIVVHGLCALVVAALLHLIQRLQISHHAILLWHLLLRRETI